MKEMLGQLADGQIEMYKAVSRRFPTKFFFLLTQSCVWRVWRSGRESFLLYSGYVLTFNTQDILSALIYLRFSVYYHTLSSCFDLHMVMSSILLFNLPASCSFTKLSVRYWGCWPISNSSAQLSSAQLHSSSVLLSSLSSLWGYNNLYCLPKVVTWWLHFWLFSAFSLSISILKLFCIPFPTLLIPNNSIWTIYVPL